MFYKPPCLGIFSIFAAISLLILGFICFQHTQGYSHFISGEVELPAALPIFEYHCGSNIVTSPPQPSYINYTWTPWFNSIINFSFSASPPLNITFLVFGEDEKVIINSSSPNVEWKYELKAGNKYLFMLKNSHDKSVRLTINCELQDFISVKLLLVGIILTPASIIIALISAKRATSSKHKPDKKINATEYYRFYSSNLPKKMLIAGIISVFTSLFFLLIGNWWIFSLIFTSGIIVLLIGWVKGENYQLSPKRREAIMLLCFSVTLLAIAVLFITYSEVGGVFEYVSTDLEAHPHAHVSSDPGGTFGGLHWSARIIGVRVQEKLIVHPFSQIVPLLVATGLCLLCLGTLIRALYN